MENRSVDAMHDLFSTGICKYGFTEILDHYTYNKKYFTIDDFNRVRRNIGELSLGSELKRMRQQRET